MKNQSWQNLLKFLEESAVRLRQLEHEAGNSLHHLGGQEHYEQLQREKTELLLSLPELASSLLRPLPPELQKIVAKGLEEFSAEARMAKKVDSLFYMSVLLYPEDDDGSHLPNGFDVWLQDLRQADNC